MTVEHRVPIKECHREHIRSGKKSWDLRLKTRTYEKVNVGDTLIFYVAKKPDIPPLRMTVDNLRGFSSFNLALCV